MMASFIIAFFVFISGYVLNMLYITVFYHRALTHGAVELKPWARKFVLVTGSWLTGIDAKSWICMHRMHHEYSDTELDPHSPRRFGVFKLLFAQAKSYDVILAELQTVPEKYVSFTKGLDFPVHFLHRKKIFVLPYILHAAIGFGIGHFFHSSLLGWAYWLGIMSHPIQGWLVNSFAHWYGYRNFDSSDCSQNNLPVAFFVFGEGLQNNHHHDPRSARFSIHWWEPDFGYGLCHVARLFGMVEKIHLRGNQLIPQKI